MKNAFRKFLISACLTACVGTGAVALGTLSVAPANAAVTEESNYFTMVDGAEVRAVTDSCGLRFITNVGEYMFTTTWEGYTVSFGTLIAKNVTDITAVNAEDETTYLADIPCTKTVEFADGEFTYTSAVVFDTTGWTDEEKTAAYAMELTGRAYAKLEKDGETTYAYATANDTTRSMRAVANVALLKGASETLLGEYVKVGARNEKDYLETSDETTNSLGLGVTAANLGVYDGAKKVGVTGENGAVDLSALATDWTLGENHFVSVFDADDKVYSAPVQYVTKAIDSTDDLSVFTVTTDLVAKTDKTIGGYFVLAEDVDFSSQAAIHHAGMDELTGRVSGSTQYRYYNDGNCNVGFAGTFDGNGFKLTANVDSYGFFGGLQNGAMLKNVEFDLSMTKATQASRSCSALAHRQQGSLVTLENVIVAMHDKREENNQTVKSFNLSLIQNVNTGIKMTNVVVVADCEWLATHTDGTTTKNGGVLFLSDGGSTDSALAGSWDTRAKNVYIVYGEKVALTYHKSYAIRTVYAGNDAATGERAYSQISRIATLSAITDVTAYEELAWTYDAEKDTWVWKN